MEKVHLIGWALLTIIITASAITATVTSIAEGKALLGTGINLQETGCKVYSIEKTATTQAEFNDPWTVKFAMEYTIDGRQTREGVKTVLVANNTETAVKTAVEPLCDADWTKAQAKHGTIDTIIVQTLAKDNPVLNKVYSAAKKTWNSLSAQP